MTFKRLFIPVFIFLFSTILYAQSDQNVALKTLVPEPQHARLSQVVNLILIKNHYSKPEVNDDFSKRIYKKYMSDLDLNKMYFLKSDVDQFKTNELKFEDYLSSGTVLPAFDIFNTYIKRVNEQAEFAINRLKKSFDFTKDESLEQSRENADYFRNKDEQNTWWNKKVKSEALALKLSGKDDTSIAETLTKRYQAIQKQLSQLKSEDAFSAFMNAFTESFDPHTSYFSPRSSEDFKISMSLSVEGIGAQLRAENDYIKVVEIIVGGPADKSKLLFADDRIVAVGQGVDGKMVDVVGWRIDDVVALIRGAKGSVVRLEIIPATAGPNDPHKTIELVRDKVKIEEQSAKSEVKTIQLNGQDYKIGIINIPTFYIDFEALNKGDQNYRSTTRDVKNLITKLKADKVDGIVIDLRNNGGGALKEAIELTGLFIPSGPVVQVKDSNDEIEVDEDTDPSVTYDGPLALLVNKFSASASEIFTGAIQNYGRGLIVGDQTFGKGTVQNLIDLNRFFQGRQPNTPSNDYSAGNTVKYGQLKLTIAKYYRVDGSSVQNLGVIPDIQLPTVYDNKKFGEAAEEYSLPWDKINTSDFKPVKAVNKYIPQLQSLHTNRVEKDVNYKLLVDEYNEIKKERDKTVISLNEAKRKKDREDLEKRKSDRDAARKANKKDTDSSKIAKNDDVLLNETMNILSDLISLSGSNGQKVTKETKKTN